MPQETKPLYKVLYEQRTQGELDLFTSNDMMYLLDEKGRYIATVHDLYDGKENEKRKIEAMANYQYTALAVNNLHHLAEALQDLHTACMMDSDIPVSWWRKHRETVAKAKEALNRIS